MKRINNSNFELLQDVIQTLDFKYNQENNDNIERINDFWREFIGEKISKLAKVDGFFPDGILLIQCADSYISNELYFVKEKLLLYMNKKIKNMGIIIKDIKFDYKKWKENNNE